MFQVLYVAIPKVSIMTISEFVRSSTAPNSNESCGERKIQAKMRKRRNSELVSQYSGGEWKKGEKASHTIRLI